MFSVTKRCEWHEQQKYQRRYNTPEASAGSGVVGGLDQGLTEDEDVTKEVGKAYRKALYGMDSWDDDMATLLLGRGTGTKTANMRAKIIEAL